MSRNVVTKITTPILTSAARTASGTSTAFSEGGNDNLTVLLAVTAVSGTTPSLAVTVEWTDDGTNWYKGDPADTFTAITAAGNVCKTFGVKGLAARLNYAITGTTPSFTFSASAVVGG